MSQKNIKSATQTGGFFMSDKTVGCEAAYKTSALAVVGFFVF
jgi:hypothetical protein